MSREIVGRGLRFSLQHAPCAHICRYRLISESRKRSVLPFCRFEQLVHRFHDWRQAERPDLEIGIFVAPSFDYDLETLKGIARLRERRGGERRIHQGLRLHRATPYPIGYSAGLQPGWPCHIGDSTMSNFGTISGHY